jgi:MFS family permease
VTVSGACCLCFPLFFCYASNELYIAFLLFWGIFVVADSPMFSSLVAANAPAELRGSTLTLVNSIGFLITILSIQFTGQMLKYLPFYYVWTILAIGPVFAVLQLVNRSNKLKL